MTAVVVVEPVDELENILLGLLARLVMMVIYAFGATALSQQLPVRLMLDVQCHVR